jgi:hypothetical protein
MGMQMEVTVQLDRSPTMVQGSLGPLGSRPGILASREPRGPGRPEVHRIATVREAPAGDRLQEGNDGPARSRADRLPCSKFSEGLLGASRFAAQLPSCDCSLG